MKLKVEYLPLDEITPYEANAKLHPDEQIEQIKKSIQDYGFRDPVGIWHGEIVEGHGRVIAAKELGMKEVPVIKLDDMTDEQRREYALVHNQTTLNSGFDFSVLDAELESLTDFDAEFYGLSVDIEPLFGYMDDFGGDSSTENSSFDVTLNFDIELKAQFDAYIKTYGKSDLKKACEEVVKNA